MTKKAIITRSAPGALLATAIILVLAAPKKISIRSSTQIHASKQQVFDQLRFMKNFPGWSPFRRQDPDQKFTISGTDGQVGATFSWEGVKEKSKGSQHVAGISGNNGIFIKCNITEPFQSNPTFDYSLTEKNGVVEVVQQFEAPMPVPANVFALLFGLKQKMSFTNQQGLDLLKKAAEQQQITSVAKPTSIN